MLLGIDIGTTGVRAALYDASGRSSAEASLACLYDAPEAGFAEIAPERWWRATVSVLAKLPLGGVRAIGVVGQAPTAVLVDDAGSPVAPAILWLDTRAAQEARALGVFPYYLGPKLAWVRDHWPGEALSRTRWILQSHAYLVHRLTGIAAADPSTAALCLPMFDLAARRWAAPIEGVHAEQLPPIHAAHAVVGEVTERAAKETGLPAGTPVVGGGGDFAAATLGAGVLDEGEACLMLGTAGNLLVPRRTPGRDPRLIHAHHVGADTWLSLGGTLSGGAQEWFRHALSRTASDDTGVRSPLPSFDALDGEASAVPAGAEGVLFLPYLQGERTPIWDTEARGAYVGLHLRHGRGHLWRAVLEGIALGFVDCQDLLASDGVHVGGVVAANGGGKSALFRQILCDALGVPLSYAPSAGGTVAGAAFLAGLGIGAVALDDARAWRGSSIRHEPDLASHALYMHMLQRRRAVYEALR
jgi:xylulokinase